MSAELQRFAFLIGNWRCEARVRFDDGIWHTLEATWRGRSLDGRAIEDEYRMTGPSGELIVLGTNFRAYDPSQGQWNLKWLNGLTGTWTDLGPIAFGGVWFDGSSVSYISKESMAAHTYTRGTYTNISRTHFTWRGEASDDLKSWNEFIVIEAYRDDDGGRG